MHREKASCGIGIIANLNNEATHQIVHDGIKIMDRLAHRAGKLEDGTSDGAGLLMKIPFEFFQHELNINDYSVAMLFIKNDDIKKEVVDVFNTYSTILKVREVPVNTERIGLHAKKTLPKIYQFFIEYQTDQELYYTRLNIENKLYQQLKHNDVYITSMSNQTIVYKGLLQANQFVDFYKDFQNPLFKSSMVIVHQRFSTNTLPNWHLAQPFRVLAHNGEINTIKGNLNWMEARLNEMDEIPFINHQLSDSANLDLTVDYLTHKGYSLTETLAMLVPAAWEKNKIMDVELRAFYEYHSIFMEAWDGPAALLLSNGNEILATLDRNGLRPSRYMITKDQQFILSSEIGVLDTDFSDIVETNRLEASKFIHVDLIKGVISYDEDIKNHLKKQKNYKNLLNTMRLDLQQNELNLSTIDLTKKYAYGYTTEIMDRLIKPMEETKQEAIGSFSYDTQLPFLNQQNILLFDYFKQRFAQVTNPPLDSIRESIMFSLKTNLKTNMNLLQSNNEPKVISFATPIFNQNQYHNLLDTISSSDVFKYKEISITFTDSLENGLNELIKNIDLALSEGVNVLVLNDYTTDAYPIPSLLAVSSVHQHLITIGQRMNVNIILNSQEVKEVIHFAMNIAFGADFIYPQMALELVENKENYLEAVHKGLLKATSKMGISTISSYRGSQMFDCIGIHEDVINTYFKGIQSPVSGLTLIEIEKEIKQRFDLNIDVKGEYSHVKNTYEHAYISGDFIQLQRLLKEGNYEAFKEWSSKENNRLINLRNLFEFKKNPIHIEAVESIEKIIPRFVASAMSFGALSNLAHEMIAEVMNDLNASSNCGEGGELVERFTGNKNSKIKQVASGRFGVTAEYLRSASEIQIKMAQGAKPGEGGHLPGHKVNEYVSKTRFTKIGTDLISPPPHHDIYSIEDLAQLIYDVKSVNPKALVSVKLASSPGIGVVSSGVVKTGSDKIIVSGFNGGTGASPLSSMKYTGMPMEIGLKEVHETLVKNQLRDYVILQADGHMKTAYDLLFASMMGANEFGFGVMMMAGVGCIACRSCHTNKCPVGITTQDEEYKKKFRGEYNILKNYIVFLAQHTRELLAEIGYKSFDELLGKTDVLEVKSLNLKTTHLNLSSLLQPVDYTFHYQPRLFKNAINEQITSNTESLSLLNTDRSFGSILEQPQTIHTSGYAGQSYGAFTKENVTLIHTGFGNDSFAKGIGGSTIVLRKPNELKDQDFVIVGNAALYGATSGNVYIEGSASERFCVRNSGAHVVVEGVGKHGCEYMTGGVVCILGEIDYNFGAGMSGGVVYLHADTHIENKLNNDIRILQLDHTDYEVITKMIQDHYQYTGSYKAKKILDHLHTELKYFIKIAK